MTNDRYVWLKLAAMRVVSVREPRLSTGRYMFKYEEKNNDGKEQKVSCAIAEAKNLKTKVPEPILK